MIGIFLVDFAEYSLSLIKRNTTKIKVTKLLYRIPQNYNQIHIEISETIIIFKERPKDGFFDLGIKRPRK